MGASRAPAPQHAPCQSSMAQFSKLNLIVLGFVMAAALLSALLFSLTPALETLKASSPIFGSTGAV